MSSLTAAPPTVYGMHISAGCRLAIWSANISGVAINFESVNLMQGEHKTPEFIELTRGRHCVPALSHTLPDGTRFSMTESRAIARYLCRIGNGSVKVTFENAPHLTASVDEWLDYDATCLYKRMGAVAYPRLGFSSTPAGEAEFEALRKSLKYVDDALAESGFLVGGTLSIADLNIANTLSMMSLAPEIDVEVEFPAADKWLTHLSTLGNYEELSVAFRQFAASKTTAGDD